MASIISMNGRWRIKAGEPFYHKGHECILVATASTDSNDVLDAEDTLKINGTYYTLKRKNWILKFK